MSIRFLERPVLILVTLARLEFFAVSENYFLQAHDFRSVLQAISNNGHLISRLQRIPGPARPSEIVRAIGLDEPFFGAAVIVFCFQMNRGMWIDIFKLCTGP